MLVGALDALLYAIAAAGLSVRALALQEVEVAVPEALVEDGRAFVVAELVGWHEQLTGVDQGVEVQSAERASEQGVGCARLEQEAKVAPRLEAEPRLGNGDLGVGCKCRGQQRTRPLEGGALVRIEADLLAFRQVLLLDNLDEGDVTKRSLVISGAGRSSINDKMPVVSTVSGSSPSWAVATFSRLAARSRNLNRFIEHHLSGLTLKFLHRPRQLGGTRLHPLDGQEA